MAYRAVSSHLLKTPFAAGQELVAIENWIFCAMVHLVIAIIFPDGVGVSACRNPRRGVIYAGKGTIVTGERPRN
jgi:hypothetical protein